MSVTEIIIQTAIGAISGIISTFAAEFIKDFFKNTLSFQ